ncbi:cell division protein FtsA [Paroceanicella profunda]|uniref:Cell division protein FtsA n=1 Tax=Paroceanicella profunda TaxID=2579971 RepID=A0A5B8FVI8_9RHOB|nr:cell division protein FtsA [Paroceanicella profunda]QDL90499.1 cell division protein FtsA [Paroceanicella profunda]
MSSRLFESQRYMRDRLRSALRRGVVGVIDIGSSKISCLILKVDVERLDAHRADGHGSQGGLDALRAIGFSSTRSRGVSMGEIAVMDETERGIRTVLAQAQKHANTRVDQVIVSIAGGQPRSYGVSGEVGVANGEVSAMDIGAALAACDMPSFGEGRDVIHAQPVNFTLDHRTGLADPRGQVGARLSVDMHMLTVSHAAIRNIAHVVKRCDLDLAGVAVSPYASGLSALVEDEMELGAACVDMGAETTSVSVFLKRHMIFADMVRLGGQHITQDIAQAFAAPVEDAERTKTLHGELQATGMDDREMLELRRIGADREYERRQISRTELIGVIRPRVEEILEDVRASLDAAGFEYLPSQRVVLTGGTSQMPGMEDLASRILGRQVRIGRPLRIQGLPLPATAAPFSATVGLAAYAARPQDECWDFDLPARHGPLRLRRAMRWFRENW